MAAQLSEGQTEKVVITDVTRMHGNRVCIAGLDRNCNCIRPVLSRGALTVEHLYKDGKLIMAPRNVIAFHLTEKILRPPHTEDCVYDPARAELQETLTVEQMRKVLVKSCFGSVDEIFGEPLIEGKYLKPGMGERPTRTVRARVANIDLANQRISFCDKSGKFYPLRKVTDLSFHAYAAECTGTGQEKAVVKRLKWRFRKADDVFLRLSLTRPWARPDGVEGCWLQITGVHSFPDYLGERTLDLCMIRNDDETKPREKKETIETEKSSFLDKIREKHPHAYTKWTEEDDGTLVEGFRANLGIDELARKLGRQPTAIRIRLDKLGAL